MSDCAPCKKNKVFSKQFDDKEKNESKEMKVIKFEEGIYERTIKKIEKKVNEIKTFSQAIKSVKSGEAYLATPEIRENRLKICSECEEIKRADNSKKQGDNVEIGDYCGICGCFLRGSKIINAFLPDFCKTCYIGDNFKCPKEKWGNEYQ